MMTLVMPWPSTDLSPNARVHWAVLARAKKAYREACGWQAKAQGARRLSAERLEVTFTFYPPTKRRIDLDNCIARMKAGIDGIADQLGEAYGLLGLPEGRDEGKGVGCHGMSVIRWEGFQGVG